MADEAFALSPISARAELPSERDYDAIREAFMETARGRWFLGEYGKRNRNADTTMVLDAVARIEATIAAQKPAPSSELPDALVLIRGLLSDAKASAARTMSGPDAELALAAVNKATRIIREIAWTLREYGTDTRICDLLDAQVTAIETNHQHTIAPEKRDAVLATFDLLIRRIGELGGSSDPASFADSETASSTFKAEAAATMAAAAKPSFETAPQTTPYATADMDEFTLAQTTTRDAAPVDDVVSEAAQAQNAVRHDALARDVLSLDTPVQSILTQETLAQETLAQGALPHDSLGQGTPARNALAEAVLTQEAAIEKAAPILTSSESSTAALTDVAAEITFTVLPTQEVAAAPNAEAAALDLEIAQDMAVLDAIALEMAEPDFPRTEQPSLAEARSAESNTAAPITVQAGAATPASDIAVAPEPSLGETLIASGIFSARSAASDALAPIRRMTQAERVAFFS